MGVFHDVSAAKSDKKPLLTTTKTQTFSNPHAALENARKLLAKGEIKQGDYDKIKKKVSDYYKKAKA